MKASKQQRRSSTRRLISLFMTLAMTLSLMPVIPTASAADTSASTTSTSTSTSSTSDMDSYLEKAVEWGIVRGDINGNLNADRKITRAEFVAMVNRAYGYTKVGSIPFTDVKSSDWFYDDICIAYNAGYFNGTTATTASPRDSLTREQAAVLIGRNMSLEESSGEALGFSDTRSLHEWSRGMIQALSESGIISGYADGSFRPRNAITRGAVAAMLVRAIGTPIQESGEYALGNVYGNVTITSTDVTLRDTTIAGDLYLTGGIGLGDLELQNVEVLGRIVVSGAGESEKADSSILLRNVTADNMVINSPTDQFVTLRSEGDTIIGSTSVRSSAYLEDVTADGYGLQYIELDGDDGVNLELAGNIKEVRNVSPNSSLVIAQGSAATVTVDEEAPNATLSIENGARVLDLNLDVATSVSGAGDVTNLSVSAADTTVSILPDQIAVRPGLTSNISGQTMDTVAAAESSADPRIQSGYPAIRDIAPSTADAVFSTNKSGTLYWAVSALTDGSISEADLISPPSYSGKILQKGTIKVAASKTEMTAKLTGLTSDGSYYLSAVLVDDRGQSSPVKIVSFSTPDDSTPGFATGYPEMTKITKNSAQVTVMPTKSCKLYYAVLPKGSVAPTAANFKAAAVTGNMGYGTVDVVKNVSQPITVNNVPLSELTSYDLYLWLTDYDGAKSSAVQKLTFTTIDGTPPVIRSIRQTAEQATSVGVTFAVSETSTLYWAVVKEEDADTFLQALNGQSVAPLPTDTAAKIQVESGMGALKKGSSAAAKADTEYTFTVSGLTSETYYTLFYVAKDTAGNYSNSVETLRIHTLDNTAPGVSLEFTKYDGTNTSSPLANTDIRLVFSENIQFLNPELDPATKTYSYDNVLTLYQNVLQASEGSAKDAARKALGDVLSEHIKLYVVGNTNALAKVYGETDSSEAKTMEGNWVVDYRYATVSTEDSKMVITLPTVSTPNNGAASALNLQTSTTYYFLLNNVLDFAKNKMDVTDEQQLRFTTVSAQIKMIQTAETSLTYTDQGGAEHKDERVDISFQLIPLSTATVPDSELWQMLLGTDIYTSFDVYRRVLDKSGNPVADPDFSGYTTTTGWHKLTTTRTSSSAGTMTLSGADTSNSSTYQKDSLQRIYDWDGKQINFQPVKNLKEDYTYEYAIQFKALGETYNTTYEDWNYTVNLAVQLISATLPTQRNVANQPSTLSDYQNDGSVSSIGLNNKGEKQLNIKWSISDQKAPQFIEGYPLVHDPENTSDPTNKNTSSASASKITELTSDSATIEVQLNRNGEVYWVAGPEDVMSPQFIKGSVKDIIDLAGIYGDAKNPVASGASNEGSPVAKVTKDTDGNLIPQLSKPDYTSIIRPQSVYGGASYRHGSKSYTTGTIYIGPDDGLANLLPSTTYYICFVLYGGGNYSDVYIYQFTTKDVERPVLTLQFNGASGSTVNTTVTTEVADTSDITYVMVEKSILQSSFLWKETLGDTGNHNDDLTGNAATAYGGLTLVEAMIKDYSTNNQTSEGSIFDKYASQDVKERVRSYISGKDFGGANQVPAAQGTLSGIAKNNPQTVSKQLNSKAEHYMLAFAKHSSANDSDSGDKYPFAFRALSSIVTASTSVPNCNEVDQYIGSLTPDANGNTYSGSFTLTFTDEVYYLSNSNSGGSKRLKVYPYNLYEYDDDGNITSTGMRTDLTDDISSITNGWVPVQAVIGADVGKKNVYISDESKYSARSFSFKVKNITPGQTIVLFQSGSIASETGATDADNYILKVTATLTNNWITDASGNKMRLEAKFLVTKG